MHRVDGPQWLSTLEDKAALPGGGDIGETGAINTQAADCFGSAETGTP